MLLRSTQYYSVIRSLCHIDMIYLLQYWFLLEETVVLQLQYTLLYVRSNRSSYPLPPLLIFFSANFSHIRLVSLSSSFHHLISLFSYFIYHIHYSSASINIVLAASSIAVNISLFLKRFPEQRQLKWRENMAIFNSFLIFVRTENNWF